MRHKLANQAARQGMWLLLVILAVASQPAMSVEASFPPTWDIVTEDFELGTLEDWHKISENDLSLVPGGGRDGSTGLSVSIGQHTSYLYYSGVAHVEEGYLTFWFNPGGVNIPNPGTLSISDKSIRIADVKGPGWRTMVGLWIYSPDGQGYKAYLEWHSEDGLHTDYESGEFDVTDGWQKLTLGYRIDEWVAVWADSVLERRVAGITHEEAFGDIISIGKSKSTPAVVPTGTLRYDDVAFEVPRIDDLWVDAVKGDDGDDGLTPTTAFRTIQKAADKAGPGTTVHIMPGVYRETVWPVMSGSATEPSMYISEENPGTVALRGSEPSNSLSWMQLEANTIGLPPGVDPTDIYYADLSAWGLDGPPRFVVELDGNGEVATRLPLAREPDWQIVTEWKHHEFWWAADGGSDVAGCDPTTDGDPGCDFPWRSATQLTDWNDDADPPGVEAGNLATVGDLTGATLVALDAVQGHWIYRRTIVSHEPAVGRITVDRSCKVDFGNPGLGWGSKYYVEGKPNLMDSPGEWWYDEDSRLLYLWPRTAGDPATMNIEISRRDSGLILTNRSYITLDGLIIEFHNQDALLQDNDYAQKSYNNSVRNTILRYANRGLWLSQTTQANSLIGKATDGFTLEDSEIGYMDTYALRVSSWWEDGAAPDSFTRSGVSNTTIRNNELHHLGFRTDAESADGAIIVFPNQLHFEGNHVHHVAHNGVQFLRSVIQSPKEYGFEPGEIKTGEILIKDNVFEKACQLSTDCGALKIWGRAPDTHVFRDLLITGNVFRDTFGWTYVTEKRGRWSGGPASDLKGMGGFGLYVDNASGIHAYRNIAYNNAHFGFHLYGVWRDGDIVYYNNVAANSLVGFRLGGVNQDTHGHVSTRLVNNIIVNNEGYGIALSTAGGDYGNLTIDHNLYYNNGWRPYENGGLREAGAVAIDIQSAPDEYYPTLADIQASTPWEAHGVEGNPRLWDYDVDDHNLFDGSWPDFHLTAASENALNQGTNVLPDSLVTLLEDFDITDFRRGDAYDIGRYEGSFALLVNPSVQFMSPGGVARYDLSLHPPDLPHTVTLTATSSSPYLTMTLSSSILAPDTPVLLTVTHSHTGSLPLPALSYTVPITATGGGFTETASARLLVGGARVYLVIILRNDSGYRVNAVWQPMSPLRLWWLIIQHDPALN